jgi:hypothetical protein
MPFAAVCINRTRVYIAVEDILCTSSMRLRIVVGLWFRVWGVDADEVIPIS